MLLKLLTRGEGCAAKRLALGDGRLGVGLIEPGRARWDEMEVDLRMLLEPSDGTSYGYPDLPSVTKRRIAEREFRVVS
jgi:hypothetical protein